MHPILIILYNRPETTNRLIDRLRSLRPQQLFIAADGPKLNQADKKGCKLARAAVEKIDWKCTVKRNYAASNMGLRKRMVTAISWFFNQVEAGIILEDDCIADLSFFKYCSELLDRYKNDKRIMAISGSNFQNQDFQIKESYYFSKYAHCWGWATWKRAWNYYDDQMSFWPDIKRQKKLEAVSDGWLTRLYWENVFDALYKDKINSWAYRWQLACWANSGLTILPKVNLVENIGFGALATHTLRSDSRAQKPAQRLKFPLIHPQYIVRNVEADKITTSNRYLTPMVAGGLIKKLFWDTKK